jgi:hypothetical protein
VKEIIDISSSFLEYLFSSIENSHFSLNFIKSLLHRFVVIVLNTESSSILFEIVPFQILGATKLLILLLLLAHSLFQSNLFNLNLAHLLGFCVFFLANGVGLGLVNSKLVVSGSVLSNLTIEITNFTVEAFHIRGETLKLSLGGLGLLKKHFDSLETLTLVIEFTANNIVTNLAVLSGLVS